MPDWAADERNTGAVPTDGDRAIRFSVLLGCMLAALLLAPLFGTSETGVRAGRFVALLILLAGLSAVGAHRSAIALFIPTVIVQLIAHRSNASPVIASAVLLRLLFFIYVAGVIVSRVMRERSVTMDTVAGAACVYMLLGFGWAQLYTLTTVGYGDIHPTNAGAGGIAAAEALVGQLYLATMIARLVALQIVRRMD